MRAQGFAGDQRAHQVLLPTTRMAMARHGSKRRRCLGTTRTEETPVAIGLPLAILRSGRKPLRWPKHSCFRPGAETICIGSSWLDYLALFHVLAAVIVPFGVLTSVVVVIVSPLKLIFNERVPPSNDEFVACSILYINVLSASFTVYVP